MAKAAARDDWDQHWTDFSEASRLAPSTRYRHRVIEKLLAIPDQGAGARVLEIGCGTGAFSEIFMGKYPKAQYLGLDMSAAGIELARNRKVPSATYRQRDLLKPMADADRTDFRATHAICSEVLEHIDSPETLLRNSLPYMAEGCKIVITVPGGPMSAFHRHIGHRMHYTPDDLRGVLQRAGLRVTTANGVGWPFFNAYYASLRWRGEKAIAEFSKPPGVAIHVASVVFNSLFYLNSMKSGWQIVGIAEATHGKG